MKIEIEETEAEPMIIGEKQTTIPLSYIFGASFLTAPILFKMNGKYLYEIVKLDSEEEKKDEN